MNLGTTDDIPTQVAVGEGDNRNRSGVKPLVGSLIEPAGQKLLPRDQASPLVAASRVGHVKRRTNAERRSIGVTSDPGNLPSAHNSVGPLSRAAQIGPPVAKRQVINVAQNEMAGHVVVGGAIRVVDVIEVLGLGPPSGSDVETPSPGEGTQKGESLRKSLGDLRLQGVVV